jgi:hypothetical protein
MSTPAPNRGANSVPVVAR